MRAGTSDVLSKFREKPQTKIAWRAMWLGFATLLMPPFLGIFGAVIRPMIDPGSLAGREGLDYLGLCAGFAVAALALALSVAAIVTGIRAYKIGERSWVLWVGFVPAVLIGCFWILMFAGEILLPH